MALTKPPLSMLDAGTNAEQGDHATFNGQELQVSPFSTDDEDTYVNGGSFDPETGTLTLTLSGDTLVAIGGFLTASNIGTGATGPRGPQGQDGAPGRDGLDGAPGLRGCPGPKGDRGQIGPTGPLGPTGPQGQTGDPGPTGSTGPSGTPGNDGTSPIYTSGSPASVEEVPNGKITQWGRYTDTVPENTKQILFPRAFASRCDTFIIQWINPETSPVANQVKIVDKLKGGVTLSVLSSFTGTASGWDFMWLAIGE